MLRDNRVIVAVPPLAHGSALLGATRDLQRDQLGAYARAMAEHGDIARFRVGPPGIGFTFYSVFSPPGAHEVLASDAGSYNKDAPVIAEFRHFLGDGLLVNDGEVWRRHRRIAQPLFTRRAVAASADLLAAAGEDLADWCEDAAARDEPLDLHGLAMRWALHALGHSVFGDDIATVAPTLRDLLPPLGEHLKRRSLSPLRSPHWLPTPANREGERIRRGLWDVADRLVAERRAAGAGGTDLLSRLISARDPETGEGLSPAEVRDEVIIFLVAGHETTGSALAFTLHLLGRHGEVQEKLRREVTDQSASDSPYLTAVIKESLRLYPPAHTVVRRSTADTELLGYPVERGRIVAVSLWGIHHRPEVWPEPESFRPERFLGQEAQASSGRRDSSYTHIPFGGGPRACIGEHLAMAELTAAVSALVRRYRLVSLVDEPATEVDLSLGPRGLLPCRLERL